MGVGVVVGTQTVSRGFPGPDSSGLNTGITDNSDIIDFKLALVAPTLQRSAAVQVKWGVTWNVCLFV